MMEIVEKTVNVDGGVEVAETFIVKGDAGELCRLCANTDNQLIPIYRGEGLEHHISVKIEKHLPIIKVTEVDKLPLQICYQCASTLISWHNLYEGCLVADKRLREILSIDEKLCQEDESFGDYVDDYRDNYDDDTHETLPTSTNTSNLESNTSKDNSTVIPILSDTKVFNETDLEGSDERLIGRKTGIVILNTNEYEILIPDMVADDALSPIVENHSRPKKTLGSRKRSSTSVSSVEHVCTYCSLTFGSRVAIERHLKDMHSVVVPHSVHNVENIRIVDAPSPTLTQILHKCALCSKMFLSRVAIERHLKEMHNGGVSSQSSSTNSSQSASGWTVQLPSVQVVDKSVQKLKTARKSNPRPRYVRVKHTCAFCSKKFRSKVGIEKHLKEAHNGLTASTSKESIKFDDKFYFTCENCGKKFSDKIKLNRHLKKYSKQDAEPPVCDICDKKFRDVYIMRRHKKNYHADYIEGDDEFWGRPATAATAAEDKFAETLIVKIDNKKTYQCDHCPYKCNNRTRIVEHRRIHTGERPYCCDKCGQQFNNRTLLRNHLLFVHEGVKKFACDICGKTFTSKHYVEEHRRIHTGEKPFVCDLCGSAYTHLTSLLTHKNRHSDVRKFKCSLCPETFIYRSALNLHTKRHTGDFRHKCGECGKAFIDKQHLSRHLVIHSDARPFSCDICGATFKLRKYLGSHMKTHMNKK